MLLSYILAPKARVKYAGSKVFKPSKGDLMKRVNDRDKNNRQLIARSDYLFAKSLKLKSNAYGKILLSVTMDMT